MVVMVVGWCVCVCVWGGGGGACAGAGAGAGADHTMHRSNPSSRLSACRIPPFTATETTMHTRTSATPTPALTPALQKAGAI